MATEDKGKLLQGPRRPFWTCTQCGTASNFACRIVCRCGHPAPRAVATKAKEAANDKTGGAKPRGGAEPSKEAKKVAELQKKVADLQKQLKDGKPPSAPSEGGTAPKGGESDSDAKERSDRIKVLEDAIRNLKAGGFKVDNPAVVHMQADLAVLYDARDKGKPSWQLRRNMQNRIDGRAKVLERYKEEVESHNKEIEATQDKIDEKEQKVAELKIELAKMRADEPFGDAIEHLNVLGIALIDDQQTRGLEADARK